MLKLYFVRHGETLSNTWHTLQGWSDTPLTKAGIKQGKDLGKGLFNIPFLKIYTSTSERAYDTACYAKGNRDIEIIMNKGLKEMNFGTLECQSNTFKGCQTYIERVTYPWDKVDGENIDQLTKRMKKCVDEIVEANKQLDGNIMCVTHGLSILAAIRNVDEKMYDKCLHQEIRFGNCSITIITWDNGKYMIEEINNEKYVNEGGRNEKDN